MRKVPIPAVTWREETTGIVVREYYNLGVLLPSILVEAALVIMIWLPRRQPLSGTAARIFSLAAFLATALWVAFFLPDPLFFPYDFSVGMDTVFNTRYAFKVIGYALGIKKNETAYGVGLDACDICGASGYYERNDQVICILCDVVMNKSTIGFPGGCNPVPLAYRVEDGKMRIEIADLEKDLWRFKE